MGLGVPSSGLCIPLYPALEEQVCGDTVGAAQPQHPWAESPWGQWEIVCPPPALPYVTAVGGAHGVTCRPGSPVGEGTAWGAWGGWCVARQ